MHAFSDFDAVSRSSVSCVVL